MKIEVEIADISRQEIVEAVARCVLGQDRRDEEEPWQSSIEILFRRLLEAQIKGLAESLVREKFDEVIGSRIDHAVDTVLSEGWPCTDGHGNALLGQKVDLKGRIAQQLEKMSGDGYSKPRLKHIDRLVIETLEKTLQMEFKPAIDAARKALRDQLDTAVMTKFAEAVKSALGIR